MTTKAHTPGPWTINEARPHGIVWVDAPGMPSGICDLYHTAEGKFVVKDNATANARLIAAAPDMLEALKEAVAFNEWVRRRFEWPDFRENLRKDKSLDAAKAAIKLAEGMKE